MHLTRKLCSKVSEVDRQGNMETEIYLSTCTGVLYLRWVIQVN